MSVEPPFERMAHFRERLELTEADLRLLDPYRDVFVSHENEYADFFQNYMLHNQETRRFVELERRPGLLWNNWRNWFEGLFTLDFSEKYFAFLWSSGLLHVARGVDQRYINLGYCKARLFCQKMIDDHVESGKRHDVSIVVNKMLDLCLLVATDAFIAQTTQCDREVMQGIAHQIRNPLSIIGGNLQSLRRKADPADPFHSVYETMFQEALRLERMVADVGLYIRLYQEAPAFEIVNLPGAVREAWDDLRAPFQPEIDLDPAYPEIRVDRSQFLVLLREILVNAMEAADQAAPRLRVSSRPRGGSNFILLEVFNNGEPLSEGDLANVFTPFHSSKALGSGFGLPIARLVAKKFQSDVELAPVWEPERVGTVCRVSLPLAG